MVEQPTEAKAHPPDSEPRILPGLHYASVRHLAELGPPPSTHPPDGDWGVEGFEIPVRTTPQRETLSTEAFRELVEQALSDGAPGMTGLKKDLVTRCRRAHAEDVERRRRSVTRRRVEEELKQRAEGSKD